MKWKSLAWLCVAAWVIAVITTGCSPSGRRGAVVLGEAAPAISSRSTSSSTSSSTPTFVNVAPVTTSVVVPSGPVPLNLPLALEVSATDDGPLTYRWSLVSGPGVVTFSAPDRACLDDRRVQRARRPRAGGRRERR